MANYISNGLHPAIHDLSQSVEDVAKKRCDLLQLINFLIWISKKFIYRPQKGREGFTQDKCIQYICLHKKIDFCHTLASVDNEWGLGPIFALVLSL